MKNKLTDFDLGFIKYLKNKSDNTPETVFLLMVDAIGKGNGEYITEFCELVTGKSDMLKTSIVICKDF